MIKKFSDIYYHINESNNLEKKLLLQTFYYKYLIIESKFNIKKGSFLLNSFDNFSQKTITLPKSYFYKKSVLGYSLNLVSYKFESRKKLNYSFNLPVPFKNFLFSNLLKTISFSLFSKKSHFILVLSAVKGGYLVYSSAGIKGFLPYNQTKYLKIFNSSILNNSFFINKFNLLWVPINFIQFKLRSYKKNFRAKYKGRSFTQSFVFLMTKTRSSSAFNKRTFQRKIDKKKNVKEPSFKTKTYYFKKE